MLAFSIGANSFAFNNQTFAKTSNAFKKAKTFAKSKKRLYNISICWSVGRLKV